MKNALERAEAASTEHLSLRNAIAEFLVARDDHLEPTTMRGYRSVLHQLDLAYPSHQLSAFEGPAGEKLVKVVLDDKWGGKSPETYRRNLSMLRAFFEWHRTAGNVGVNPADGLTYPAIKRNPRRQITGEETEKVLRANPDPRDQVPLRLLLTLGLQKGPVRRLRFKDFDAANRTVSYERRNRVRTLAVADADFWVAFEALMNQRQATTDEYVMPAQVPRKYNARPHEIATMERDGVIDRAGSYLFQKHDGRWYRARVTPTVARDEHGVQNWWYRCLGRAGLVAPGVESGFPMQSARYTVGRRRFMQSGSLAEVQRHLGGLGRGGSAGEVYRDNADLLNKSIRVVRRRLRLATRDKVPGALGVDGSQPLMRWWKEPLRVFAEYVDDERDLIELSRVSVEMLRTQDVTSEQLHEAAETLTRAVTADDLVERAQAESRNDHPLLHGHSLVAIWSALETMIGDVVDAWLLWWPPARAKAATSVPISQLGGLPPDEWTAAVRQTLDRKYQKLNQKVHSPRRLDHFEWLLENVGLGVDTHDNDIQIRDNLWEMQRIRNVFAHKRGVADSRLTQSNPNLPFRLGDQIRIDRNAWSDFLVTTVLYADEITRRMKRELGLSDWQRWIPAPEIRYPRLDR